MVKQQKAGEWGVESNLLSLMTEMKHEQVMFFSDPELELRGIIGIHDTTLGPSLGGCRIWNYEHEADALRDVLRLSRGMTLKSSIAGINLGGGKSVIFGNPASRRDEKFWRRFGQFVNSLGGKYITAEDVGTSTSEIAHIMKETKYVSGKPVESGGSGDPSPHTALGVFLGLKAAVKFHFGTDSLEGRTVAVQGVGHVGNYLVGHLVKAGARVFVTDINEQNLKATTAQHPVVTVVSPDEIMTLDVDVYAPCALGATLNSETIPQLRCEIVAGAANNQLMDEHLHGQMLLDRSIVYAPDFLINAGGVINCYQEVVTISKEKIRELIEDIYSKTLHVLQRASQHQTSPHAEAVRMAQERIESAKAPHQ